MIRLTCKFTIKVQYKLNSQRQPKESAQIDFGLKRAYENFGNSSYNFNMKKFNIMNIIENLHENLVNSIEEFNIKSFT